MIEVGSNIGMHSVPMSHFCSEGKVFCYEPQRLIFQILCANAALNGRLNIFARQCAVGSAAAIIDIDSGDYDRPWNCDAYSLAAGFSAEGRYPGPVKTEPVQMAPLDDDIMLKDLNRLDLLKIDAEGYEIEVLRGAKRLIDRFKTYMFVENNSEANFPGLLNEIRALGYQCYWFCSNRSRQNNFNKAFWTIPGQDINMLCAPEGKRPPRDLLPIGSFDDLKQNKVPLY